MRSETGTNERTNELTAASLSFISDTHLKVTQNPSEPVDSRVGLVIMALTVFCAFGESGSWEVSKKA